MFTGDYINAVKENYIFISIIGNTWYKSAINQYFLYSQYWPMYAQTQPEVWKNLGCSTNWSKKFFRALPLAPFYAHFAMLLLSYHVSHSQIQQCIAACLTVTSRWMFPTSSRKEKKIHSSSMTSCPLWDITPPSICKKKKEI